MGFNSGFKGLMCAPWPLVGTQQAAQQQWATTGSLHVHRAQATYCKLHITVQTTWLVGLPAGLYGSHFVLPTNTTMTPKRGTENLTRRPITVATIATAVPCVVSR